VDSNGHTIGISAALSGTGGLIKQGLGTLTLSGSNSYTGPTVVEDGVLLIIGDSSGMGEITVETGAILGGTGTLGSVVVSGILAPGNSPGLLTVEGDLTMETGSTLLVEFTGTTPGTFDQLAVGGLFTAGGTLYLHVSYAATEGDSFLIFTNEVFTAGGFAIGTNLVGGLYWDTSQLASAGIVTVVPEPSVSALLALGAGIFLRRRFRHHRR
jgi:autotransporter-associated beta strand protein